MISKFQISNLQTIFCNKDLDGLSEEMRVEVREKNRKGGKVHEEWEEKRDVVDASFALSRFISSNTSELDVDSRTKQLNIILIMIWFFHQPKWLSDLFHPQWPFHALIFSHGWKQGPWEESCPFLILNQPVSSLCSYFKGIPPVRVT